MTEERDKKGVGGSFAFALVVLSKVQKQKVQPFRAGRKAATPGQNSILGV